MKYTVLLTTLAALGLAACGNKEASLPQASEANPPVTSAPAAPAAADPTVSAAAPAPAPAVPTPTPAPAAAAKPATKPASVAASAPIPAAKMASPAAPAPTTPAPVAKPTPAPVANPTPAPAPAPAPAAAPAPVSHAGQAKFKAACAGCHGQQAQGQGTFPKLAGLTAADLKAKLEKYRKGEKIGPMSAIMKAPAKALSDQEVDEIAGYIAALK